MIQILNHPSEKKQRSQRKICPKSHSKKNQRLQRMKNKRLQSKKNQRNLKEKFMGVKRRNNLAYYKASLIVLEI